MVKQTSSQTIKLNTYFYFSFFRQTFVAERIQTFPVCIYEAKAFYDESS